jgi:hypothetical protein
LSPGVIHLLGTFYFSVLPGLLLVLVWIKVLCEEPRVSEFIALEYLHYQVGYQDTQVIIQELQQENQSQLFITL